MSKSISQPYPRIDDDSSKLRGCLDDTTLVEHTSSIPLDQFKNLMREAIEKASGKSSREILSVPANATEEEVLEHFRNEGVQLFKYFHKYVSDPAATAHQLYRKHYQDIGREQFRNRSLQKERMNSGWRYQYLAVDAAQNLTRFRSISDIGTAEADFNAIVAFKDKTLRPLRLYVSVKNRSNTMGGQDWPKAIYALEEVAKADKNATGPYCCVFGIAMERGTRSIRHMKKTKQPYSVNTEIWFSDFFWPFFTNYSYQDVMQLMLEVLMGSKEPAPLPTTINIPSELLDSFGAECYTAGLLDDDGFFNNPQRLVEFFVQPLKIKKRQKSKKKS